jgi:hypothetical protein
MLYVLQTTAKLLFLPKREFFLAMMDSTQQKSFTFTVTNPKHSSLRNHTTETIVPKGALVQTHVSVRPGSDILSEKENGKYVISYQDYCGWFFDDGFGGTNIVSVMEVDLGPDVPK